ncbi:MAG: Maf family protein [Sandaracinaceae bacterium]|nr:Maf family protein [Sandaracinaceae bacterium]
MATGEGRDKRGAYGIQGLGGGLWERVEGCYANVGGPSRLRRPWRAWWSLAR